MCMIAGKWDYYEHFRDGVSVSGQSVLQHYMRSVVKTLVMMFQFLGNLFDSITSGTGDLLLTLYR
jgi:hypothetical protein